MAIPQDGGGGASPNFNPQGAGGQGPPIGPVPSYWYTPSSQSNLGIRNLYEGVPGQAPRIVEGIPAPGDSQWLSFTDLNYLGGGAYGVVGPYSRVPIGSTLDPTSDANRIIAPRGQ